MTIVPGQLDITIQPGVDLALPIQFTQSGTPLPVDDYDPFYSEIRLGVDSTLLATMTVVSTDAVNGNIVLTLDGSLSTALRGSASYDVIDAAGRRWLRGTVTFDPSITAIP